MKRFSLTVCVCVVALSGPVWAQEGDEIPEMDADMLDISEQKAHEVEVMGHMVEPKTGLFVVTDDVNVREGPGTEFKRIAGLEKGERVRSIGKVPGKQWIAVSQAGETLGFVYSPVLKAVIDGALGEQFFGSYMSQEKQDGIACDYRFRYEGKVDVEGDSFSTSDYEVRFRCASQLGARIFYAHMFLTEAPVKSNSEEHLIGLDVRSIGDGMEDYLSTRYHYAPHTGTMTFEGHSLPRFATPPQQQNFETESVKDALIKALEASIASWTDEAWTALLKKSEESSPIPPITPPNA